MKYDDYENQIVLMWKLKESDAKINNVFSRPSEITYALEIQKQLRPNLYNKSVIVDKEVTAVNKLLEFYNSLITFYAETLCNDVEEYKLENFINTFTK